MIRHVVLLKLHDPAEAPEAKRRLEALAQQVPEIRSIEIGLDVLRTDVSYDVWFTTTHDSRADLQAYQTAAAHEDFRAWVGPRLAGRAVVDSEDTH